MHCAQGPFFKIKDVNDHFKRFHEVTREKLKKDFIKSRETRHKCDQCEKKFHTEDKLIRHKHIIHDYKGLSVSFRLSCEQCEKTFTESHNLNCHVKKKHSDHKLHECEFCDMKFKRPFNLLRHKRLCHDQDCVNEIATT